MALYEFTDQNEKGTGLTGTRRSLKRDLFLTGSGNFLQVLTFGQFLLFPLYVQMLGGTAVDMGLLVGSAFISSLASRLVVGHLLDRIGRIKVWKTGGAILSLSSLLFLIPRDLSPFNYAWILFARILQGLGISINFSAGFTYAADVAPVERRSEIIGLFGVSGLSAMALGPVMGEALLKVSGFSLFFMAASVLAAVGILFICSLEEQLPRKAEPPLGLPKVLKNRPTLIAITTTFFFTFAVAIHGSFVTPFTRHAGLELVSPFFVAYSFAAIGTRVFWAKVPDQVGKNTCASPALMASAMGIMGLSLVASYPVLVLAGLVAGTGHGFLYPSLNALAVEGLPPEGRGMATSVFTGSLDGGTGFAILLLSLVLDQTNYTVIFLMTGGVVLAGMIYHRFAARSFLIQEREERKRKKSVTKKSGW